MNLKTLKKCEENPKEVRICDFFNLCEELHVEGKTGRIRFPKKLRDLHRVLTNDYKSNDVLITGQLCDVMNWEKLRYCEEVILKLNTQLQL